MAACRAESFSLLPNCRVQDASYKGAQRAFERSLNRLQVGQLDLYLIHQPYGDVIGAYAAMEELYAAGKVRAIGNSNFMPDRVMDLVMHSKVVPAVNQIETHPFCQQVESQKFLASLGILTESWGPFAEGRNEIFSNPVLGAIAAKHNKTIAQVILRWLVQRQVAVIPKTTRPERMAENMAIFDFALDDGDMAAISPLDTGKSLFLDHRDPAIVKWLSERKLDI